MGAAPQDPPVPGTGQDPGRAAPPTPPTARPRARRSRGDGAVYQEADGRWRGTLDVPPGPDGRRRRRAFRGPTEAAVRAKIRAALRERDAGTLQATRSPTLEEWMRTWLRDIAPARCAPSTLDRYRTVIEQWIVPLIGARRLDALTTGDIRSVYAAMHGAGRYSSARQAHSALRRSLKVAMAEGRVARNVAALVDGPTYERPDPSPLTRADAAAVLAAAREAGTLTRWALALALGMRQGEALGLTWAQVDTDARTITVEWQLQARRYRHACGPGRPTGNLTKGGRAVMVYPCGAAQPIRCPKIPDDLRDARLHLKRPKTRKSRRTIPYPAELAPLLTEHRRTQVRARMESGVRGGWETRPEGAHGPEAPIVVDLVFDRGDGRPVDPHDDHDEWVALLAAAGVPAARLHNARHTAATTMLELGVPPKTVSEVLGHTSFYFTVDTYSGWIESAARQAADVMGGALLDPAAPARATGGKRR